MTDASGRSPEVTSICVPRSRPEDDRQQKRPCFPRRPSRCAGPPRERAGRSPGRAAPEPRSRASGGPGHRPPAGSRPSGCRGRPRRGACACRDRWRRRCARSCRDTACPAARRASAPPGRRPSRPRSRPPGPPRRRGASRSWRSGRARAPGRPRFRSRRAGRRRCCGP